MRKHGVDCFQVEQIDHAKTLEELFEKERRHIQRLGTYTKTGQGYNMTLGGDGVFGFKFSEETKAAMAECAAARFAHPAERERQRQRQERFWTEMKRAEHSEKIARAHGRNPHQARRHAEFMKKSCDPEEMQKRARLFWDAPGAKEKFKQERAEYWSDPAHREKRAHEIRQRFAEKPNYAKNISEAKKRLYRERPELAQHHSEFMKKRFAENPALVSELSERAKRLYNEDPTLIKRIAASRKLFYERNPEARPRVGALARSKAARRRVLHDELMVLARQYRMQTGQSFAIPSRSEGGWQAGGEGLARDARAAAHTGA